MKFLIFIPFLLGLMVSPIAHADKVKCEDGFFYADGECFRTKLTDVQRDALIAHIDSFQKTAHESLIVMNDIAVGVEDKDRSQESANINKVTTYIMEYLDGTLAFEKTTGKEIKKDRIRKEKNRRYDKYGILGISIYKVTFELYDIFDEADLFELSKRQITAMHGPILDKLNFQLTSAVDVYGKAYFNDSPDLQKSRADVVSAISSSIKTLADIYAMEIAKLPPFAIGSVKEGREDVLEDAVENIYEDRGRFQRKMDKKYDH